MTLPIDVLPDAHVRPTRLVRAFRAVLVLAVVALLVLFARTIDWSHAWSLMRNADPAWLAGAVAANLASLWLKGVRWWVFLRRVGAPSLPLALRATTAGAGLNNILVANGGEAARIVFVSRATGTPGRSVLTTLAVERGFDIVSYVVILAVATLTLPLPAMLERWRVPAVSVATASLALLAFTAWRGTRRIAPDAALDPPALPSRAGVVRTIRSLAGPAPFAAAFALSLSAWLLQLATFGMTARAAGLSLPLAGTVATLLAANLGFLVRATPGNVGFFQLSYAVAAEPFGAARETAIAVALLLQTLQIVPVTLLGTALAPEFILRRRR